MGSRLEANSSRTRKLIENHVFEGKDGEEYDASTFGGFGDYFRRKKIKLQNLDAETRASASASDKPQIFKGVVAHVNGYTQPPLNILHRELVQHGAGFLQYLDSKTMATHIIASVLTMKKSVEFKQYRVVKPAWVTESIKAGKLLPWSNYRVIDEGPGQKMLDSKEGTMVCLPRPPAIQGYQQHTDLSLYANCVKTLPESARAGLDNCATRPLAATLEDTDISPDNASSLNPPQPQNSTTTSRTTETVAQKPTLASVAAPADRRPEDGLETDKTDGADNDRNLKEKPPKNLTSEEHNAWLLSDPKIRNASCANPNFLQQFYSESRLHHLSTWKAEIKSRMQKMAAEKGSAAKPVKRKPGSRRYILHVDFDSFFCAVSLKKSPEYVDKPAVVAHGSGNGSEIASSNYPARKFGVKNGMWMKLALQLCPDLKVLAYDFPAYEEASRKFYEIILDVGGVVQSVSVDEAFVDITALVLVATGTDGGGSSEDVACKEQARADEIALGLRERIKAQTGCAVSVGIGGNILLAKVALRRAKPAGQHQIRPEDALDLIGELKIEDLPGFARSLGGKLDEIGVKLVKDARQVTKERLSTALGPKTGEKLWEYARGIDRTDVGEQPPRKSVSAEINWGIRFTNQPEAEDFVRNLCKELERRMVEEQVKGKHLTVKIMRRALDAPLDPAKHLGHGKCDTFNKSIVFGVATNDGEAVGREAVSILRGFKFNPGDLRGLGVHMGKLGPVKCSGVVAEGGQKRLAFGGGGIQAPPAKRQRMDDIEEPGPQNSKSISNPNIPNDSQPSLEVADDPIADFPNSPRRRKSISGRPSLLGRSDLSSGGKGMPLNISGTQFILPSNPDPTVLAALPSDIRERLMRQADTPRQKSNLPLALGARPDSPVSPSVSALLPSEIDPKVFAELPEEMRAEILATHGLKLERYPTPQQDVSTTAPPKKPSPTKRGSIWSILSRVQGRESRPQAGLAQTSLVIKQQPDPAGQDEDNDEPDDNFLAALPPDVRREVLADYRRQRLSRRPSLDAKEPNPKHGATGGGGGGGGPRQTTLAEWPRPPPKISFPGGLTTTVEVKSLLEAWYANTVLQGPLSGDLDVFERYLQRVVLEERDMEKATRLVKFLEVTVDFEHEDGAETKEEDWRRKAAKGRSAWKKGVEKVKEAVRAAAKQRGLGTLAF